MEAGTWTVRAVRAYLGEPGKTSTNVPVVVDLECCDAPHEGEHVTAFLYFTEKTADRSVESLRFLGFDGDDLNTIVFREDARALAVMEHETGTDGKTRLRVKWINRIGSNIPKLDQAKAIGFAQSMRGHFAKFDKSNGGKPATQGSKAGASSTAASSARPGASRAEEEPPPFNDSDIPF